MTKVQFLGNSFFKIGFDDCTVLIDPYIHCPPNAPVKRKVPSPVKEKDLKGIDLILVTHEHYDHFDKEAIRKITKAEGSLVLAHQSVLNELDIPEKLKKPVERERPFTFNGVSVKAVDVHHPSAFYPLGYHVSFNGFSVFHPGDTFLNKAFSEVKANVLLAPIGGTVTMDCVDAVRAVKTMKPDYAIPMKYDTFDYLKGSPQEFKERIEKSILKTKAVLLDLKEEVEL